MRPLRDRVAVAGAHASAGAMAVATALLPDGMDGQPRRDGWHREDEPHDQQLDRHDRDDPAVYVGQRDAGRR